VEAVGSLAEEDARPLAGDGAPNPEPPLKGLLEVEAVGPKEDAGTLAGDRAPKYHRGANVGAPGAK